MSEFKQITYDEWVEQYKPTADEALDHFPEGIPVNRIWTEVESDGFYTIASGNHLVNRTGRYYVTEVAHNFDVDVEDE